jgi:hypothetical protein
MFEGTVPADLTPIGIVATLDSAYGMNGSSIRKLLPEPQIPILVASARDIEMLVAISQRTAIGPILQGIAEGEQVTWHLGPALSKFYEQTDKNPLHEASWAKYPFGS